jgi:hypothetical protein
VGEIGQTNPIAVNLIITLEHCQALNCVVVALTASHVSEHQKLRKIVSYLFMFCTSPLFSEPSE